MHNITGITKEIEITMSFVIFFQGPAPGKGNRQDGMDQPGLSIKVTTFMVCFGKLVMSLYQKQPS